MSLDEADLRKLERNLTYLPFDERARLLDLLEQRERLRRIEEARTRFLAFVRQIWPDFIAGPHHTIMAEAIEEVATGQTRRLILDLPPRFTKSEFGSWLLPAWFLGRFPKKKIIQVSNNDDLASGFGRRVRNLLDGIDLAVSDDAEPHLTYQDIFPSVKLAADSKAAGLWHTNWGGEYFAVGVKGKVTGRGADIAIVDDPHALATDTEIPTPKGFVLLKNLQVGDEVFGPDGKPTRIVAKSPIYESRELYNVKTNDGFNIYADAAHLWAYRSDTKVTASFITGRTDALAALGKANAPVLPPVAPVEYPVANLPIDPYLFGVWLGNGTATLGRITSHLDDVSWFRLQFDQHYETTDQADPNNFGVLGLRAQLIDLGLFDNKHIPEAYLVAAPAQRLALLQGLMDTDGHVMQAGSCNFDNTNMALVEGVAELVRSFGARAIIKCFPGSNQREQEATNYRVNFSLPNACRLPRKAARLKTEYGKRGRSITVHRPGYSGRVQCITVERKDGLFLAGRGYVVTHNSEQEAKQAESNPAIFDDVYSWYTSGIRQRLQPSGSIIIIVTRWSKRDLVGQVLKQMERDKAANLPESQYDKWKVLSLPAILDEGQASERSMWPGFWPLEELQRTRNALPVAKWQAQYQQNPTSETAAILKRDYWRKWSVDSDRDSAAGRSSCPGPQHRAAWAEGRPPACRFILQSWDCASTKTERAHPSAFTEWGVFDAEDPLTGKTISNIILLSGFKKRMEFPELKIKAKRFYDDTRPDALLVENKSAGMQLLQEFRSMGIPAEDFSGSSRGSRAVPNDKIARANMVVDVFASGYVWAPDRRFAEEVIEQCAEFPNGQEDDYVDSTVQAMIRFRAGGFIRTANDEADDETPRARRKRYY